ncbi:type II toxin-antitoxin system PemK/MazF family toxin [Cyanobium sp. FGCU-6]|nr:type II toxin-antitoxin system PemK/MazF family toxin [Cyanobium sp. FGCU6]
MWRFKVIHHLRNDRPSFHPVHSLIREIGPRYLHHAKGRGRSDIRKTRPCVVVSPDRINTRLRTFIDAPLTTGGHSYPF